MARSVPLEELRAATTGEDALQLWRGYTDEGPAAFERLAVDRELHAAILRRHCATRVCTLYR